MRFALQGEPRLPHGKAQTQKPETRLGAATDKKDMPAELQTILKLSVPVIVQVGERRMPMAEVLSLVPGAIIELPKPADQELDLRVNNIPIAQGTAVKVGENFGLRITAVGTTRQVVEALAGTDSSGGNDKAARGAPAPG